MLTLYVDLASILSEPFSCHSFMFIVYPSLIPAHLLYCCAPCCAKELSTREVLVSTLYQYLIAFFQAQGAPLLSSIPMVQGCISLDHLAWVSLCLVLKTL